MLRRTMLVAVALVLGQCGYQPVDEARGRVEAPVISDAGVPDAGPALWCAGDHAGCLENGWAYDLPGHCCLARQTCKMRNRDAGTMGYCAY